MNIRERFGTLSSRLEVIKIKRTTNMARKRQVTIVIDNCMTLKQQEYGKQTVSPYIDCLNLPIQG